MKREILLPLIAATFLTACDDQTAQAPVDDTSEVTILEDSAEPVDDLGAPAGPGDTTAVAPVTEPDTMAAIEPGAGPDTTGALGSPGVRAEDVQGTYVAGPVRLELGEGNTFTFEEREGEGVVSGTYLIEGDEIVFTNPMGDTAGAVFPIRCRLAPGGAGFSLQDTGGACGPFQGLEFEQRG